MKMIKIIILAVIGVVLITAPIIICKSPMGINLVDKENKS